MNNIFIAIAVLIAGGVIYGAVVYKSEPKEKIPEGFQYVEGVPCHSMGTYWMGDCTFDSEGNPTNI